MTEHESTAMDLPLTVRCVCGWQTTGSTDDVVATTEEHGRRMHNMSATRDQILAMAIPADSVPSPAANPKSPPTPVAEDG